MDRKCSGIDRAGCPALSPTDWRQPGGLWFPRLLSAERGQPRCETRPLLAAVCHHQPHLKDGDVEMADRSRESSLQRKGL